MKTKHTNTTELKSNSKHNTSKIKLEHLNGQGKFKLQ